MTITQETKEKIEKTFKSIYSNKEDISDLGKANSGLLETLSSDLEVEKKVITKTYKKWVETRKGDDSSDQADEIFEYIR